MASAYGALRRRLRGADRQRLTDSQLRWLGERDACEESSSPDACLRRVIAERTELLTRGDLDEVIRGRSTPSTVTPEAGHPEVSSPPVVAEAPEVGTSLPPEAHPAPLVDPDMVLQVQPLRFQEPPSRATEKTLQGLYRSALVRAGFRIAPPSERARQEMARIKHASYRPGVDEAQQIPIGERAAPNAVVETQIRVLGMECQVTAELHELRQETASASASSVADCAPAGLRGALGRAAVELARDLAAKQAGRSAEPAR